jgi:hypothetical protein
MTGWRAKKKGVNEIVYLADLHTCRHGGRHHEEHA